MIKKVEIKNFKSIKNLKLNCRRVNVFIGKPNSGKSNILESIGAFSLPNADQSIKEFIRIENISNLFYDNDIGEKIIIKADKLICEMKYENSVVDTGIFIKENNESYYHAKFGFDGIINLKGLKAQYQPHFNLYRFEIIDRFSRQDTNFLLPSKGDNLLFILQTNKNLRKMVSDIFRDYGFRIVLKPQEGKLEVVKEVDDIIISYPYSVISDSLQRLIFHLAAIETNKNAVIIFEEPESHLFPYYTKFIAERIALNNNNQYFIATHNPYILSPIIEKTNRDDIGIFVTYFEDYQTKVKLLSGKEITELIDLDSSAFFNIDKFVEGK